MPINSDKVVWLKDVETVIKDYSESIDKRKAERGLGSDKLDEFLREQQISRNVCDDLLKKLKDLFKRE
jgi:hypothetical protein